MSKKVSTEGSPVIRLKNSQLLKHEKEFLTSPKRFSRNLVEIVQHFQHCVDSGSELESIITIVDRIFNQLYQRHDMVIEAKPLKQKDTTDNAKHREFLQDQLRDTLRLLLASFEAPRPTDIRSAVATAVHFLEAEGRHPLENTTDTYYFPINRLRNILARLLSTERPQAAAISAFRDAAADRLDVLHFAWKLLPGLTKCGNAASTSEHTYAAAAQAHQTYIGNYLDLVRALPITDAVQKAQLFLCSDATGENTEIYNKQPFAFDYASVRSNVNKSWARAIVWPLSEQTHHQMLVVLLETVLAHLEKPVLLTDFLMDSLDVGGPISLLALQGVFTLIQQHNITYPNVYEKLYSMFEPEIFHTKYKARLFYLADIFLSSISLPEQLVAAFVKRLARLALVAPPQDVLIILYFIGNLIMRHPGLKRLLNHPDGAGASIAADPFQMDEPTPAKARALESSLWEVVALQQHAVPQIAQAARFVHQPFPTVEWDLAQVLELNENDIFDQEIAKRSKECAPTLTRPTSMFLTKQQDTISQYWQLC